MAEAEPKKKPKSSITVTIASETGLHLRAAGRFVETASQFHSDVRAAIGRREVDGKSIIDMLTLGAAAGTKLKITAVGEDASAALKALGRLVEDHFATQRPAG